MARLKEKMFNFKNKKAIVFGFGKSGIASAKKLLKEGAIVKIAEISPKDQFDKDLIQDFESSGVSFEFEGHTPEFTEGCDIAILSPGVHSDLPVIEALKKKNIPVISEIELAFQFLKKPIIAVTGTNGKTTTTTLIAQILNAGGKRASASGNIGIPLASIDDANLDFIVVEVSSYQLENIIDFRPWISIILNITEDHIERHGNFSVYTGSKGRIFKNQTTDDYLIYNVDDPKVLELSGRAAAKLVPFSKSKVLSEGVSLDGGELKSIIERKASKICKKDDIRLKGEHNMENVCAAVAASLLCRIPESSIADTLRTFEGVEHRIEHVGTISGIDFINDSKATNPNSTICALNALTNDKNILLIAGGRDKGGDLSSLCDTVKMKAKEVILIGEAKDRFKEALLSNGFFNVSSANTLGEAVRMAKKKAVAGDFVLLSPACASFDMFKNFEERGEVFKAEVLSLK